MRVLSERKEEQGPNQASERYLVSLRDTRMFKANVRFEMNKFIKIFLGVVLGGVLLVGGCFIAGVVMIHTPQTRITKQPMPRPAFVAEFGMTNIPVSASNICYASASLGMGFAGARLYRFDAPIEDCLSYAQVLIDLNNRNSSSNDQVSAELGAIFVSPDPVQDNVLKAYRFADVDWFDVENIRNGFTQRGPPSGLSTFWIDTDRNRFYYYWTD